MDRLQMDAYKEGFKAGKDAALAAALRRRSAAATRALAAERALSDALAEALRHHLVAGCSEATHADCEALSTYDDAERGK